MLFSLIFIVSSAFAQEARVSADAPNNAKNKATNGNEVVEKPAPGRSFKSAIEEVLRAPNFQSTQSDIYAIELDYESRELVLEPIVEVDGLHSNENRQILNLSSANPTLNSKPRLDSLGVTLTKPFSTGTAVEIGPRYEHALTPNLSPVDRDTVDWHITLTQDLWRDGFGRSTRLRRAREDYQRKQNLAGALLKQGQMLADFENLYWDWALSLREAELQEKNLRRSREILKWTQDRYNRAAAESTDLLQAKALLTQRELQVSALRLSLTQVGSQIERYVPNHQWQPDPNDLSVARAPEDLLVSWKPEDLGKVEQLQFIQARNEALAAEQKTRESRESIRPDLRLALTYGKNAIDPDGDTALRNSYTKDHDYSSIGVVFRSGLDLGSEYKKVESAKAAQVAAEQRREAYTAENRVAWEQLKRELADQQVRVERAHQLVDLQMQKANAERERYRKGKSTAFQAITFEQDAAEAEITLWQLYGVMRKTEARARLFAR